MREEQEVKDFIEKLRKSIRECRNTRGNSCPRCRGNRLRIRVLEWVLR